MEIVVEKTSPVVFVDLSINLELNLISMGDVLYAHCIFLALFYRVVVYDFPRIISIKTASVICFGFQPPTSAKQCHRPI